jgi:hypothetical protein
MVQWKGSTQKEQAGEKAANLDSIESFDVPNFFVLTKSEVENIVESKEPQRIANQKLPEEKMQEVKEAYQDIGVSSEVRKASGQARNLVGNQRESQRVSIRISSNNNQTQYKLNVGASGLEDAIKEIITSYYERNNEAPALIFQKMIEPEYTGAVINSYTRTHSLVEMVEGLGHSLEEGITVPELYLLKNSKVQETRSPEKQVKVSRNPMNGQRRTRTVSKTSVTFKNTEIEDLAKKTSREGLSIKFVYKRGSFYAVDAFKARPVNTNPDLEALKVSEGEIKGREGRDYILSEETTKTEKPLVSKKGGYTSTEPQRKRREKTPAVVSLKNKQKIRGKEKQKTSPHKTEQKQEARTESNEPKPSGQQKTETESLGVTATEVRPIKTFSELSDNPFSYQESNKKFADTCEEILAEKPELIDARNINQDALIQALKTLENIKILATENVSGQLIKQVIKSGVEVLAVPEESIDKTSQRLLRQEKRFIMDNLRE